MRTRGTGLLAFILVFKYDDHLPLYRLNEIFARMGADIPDTTLADWCGRSMRTLMPLTNLITRQIMASDRLHADDTPIRVLDRGKRSAGLGKGVKEGRIWTYVRDDRPWNGSAPPGALYDFSPDRKGEHPQGHLKDFRGILQADAYAGFRDLYKPDASGDVRVRDAACWAHLRRDVHDVWKATKSGIAREALDRIMEHRTSFVVAHRLSTVRRCDRIVVMAQGRIQCIGSHGELMKTDNFYSRIVKSVE